MKCQFPTKNSLSFKVFFLFIFLKIIQDGGHGWVGLQNVWGEWRRCEGVALACPRE